MPPSLALLLGFAFMGYGFWSARKRGIRAEPGLLLPTLWYLTTATRNVGVWCQIWNIPVPGGRTAADGSPVDAAFYLLLATMGLVVLAKRHFSWGEAMKANPWVGALFVYMACSILWSSYNYVSFKRYIKCIGCVSMALVVLTQANPLESVLTVLRRILYLHLPVSLVCIKYFRPIGVSYDFSGSSQAWQGISTSKNELGQVVMLGTIYFAWQIYRQWPQYKWKTFDTLYFLLSLYLLKGSENEVSMTSVATAALAMVLFLRMKVFAPRLPPPDRFVRRLFWIQITLVTFVGVHSMLHFTPESIFGHMITMLGRDITMTGRTLIWHDVYAAASRNPLLGVGYGGFWIGREANIPWNAGMTWILGQAHNGYVDTYLQLGLIGEILLAGTIISTLPRLLADLHTEYDFACFRIILLVTIVFVNVTETTFLRGDHHLWFIFQNAVWLLPPAMRTGPGTRVAASAPAETSDTVAMA